MTISKEKLIQMYRWMKLSRSIEHNLELLYKQGRLPGAIYPGIGQEAVYAGSVIHLNNEDALGTTHRDLAALLIKGITPEAIMAQHFAKETGPTRGRGEDNYLGDISKRIFTGVSMLPDLYPVVVGAALYFVRKNLKNVGLAFCGEGASARGDFHESLNWASVFNLPVVFVVVNNQFAYSTPNNLEFKLLNVADRAKGYGMDGYVVDGNDVLAVYEVTQKVVEKARNGGGPSLIEAKTFRMKGHAGHDPADYVDEKLREEWAKKDPIDRFEKYLTEQNFLNDNDKSQIEKEIEQKVNEAIAFAQKSPDPDPSELTIGVYSD